RLLAAKTIRPWSKKTVLTVLPERTWRSPLLRPSERARRVSPIGVTARSVSMTSKIIRRGGRSVDGEGPPGARRGPRLPGGRSRGLVQDHQADPQRARQRAARGDAGADARERLACGEAVLAVVHEPVDAEPGPLAEREARVHA